MRRWLALVGLAVGIIVVLRAYAMWGPKRPQTVLVYQVHPRDHQAGQKVDMGKVISAIRRRVDPAGTKEILIRPCGPEQIEVVVVGTDEQEAREVKALIESPGTLEFRIVADKRHDERLIHRALLEKRQHPKAHDVKSDSGKLEAWWVPVDAREARIFQADSTIATWEQRVESKEKLEVLVKEDPYNVTGDYLQRVSPDVDDEGRRCVKFRFDARGGNLFGKLTGRNVPDEAGFKHKLGIILNGQLYSAPELLSAIHGEGQITGSFTDKDVKFLVDVLNAGSLPATLEPVSEYRVGPAAASTNEKPAKTEKRP
jgi:SecD/SecF fusion protein